MTGAIGAVGGGGAAASAAGAAPIGGAGVSTSAPALGGGDASTAPSSIVELSEASRSLDIGSMASIGANNAATPYKQVEGLVSPLGAAVQIPPSGASNWSAPQGCIGVDACSPATPALKALDSLADLLIMLLIMQMMDTINANSNAR